MFILWLLCNVFMMIQMLKGNEMIDEVWINGATWASYLFLHMRKWLLYHDDMNCILDVSFVMKSRGKNYSGYLITRIDNEIVEYHLWVKALTISMWWKNLYALNIVVLELTWHICYNVDSCMHFLLLYINIMLLFILDWVSLVRYGERPHAPWHVTLIHYGTCHMLRGMWH